MVFVKRDQASELAPRDYESKLHWQFRNEKAKYLIGLFIPSWTSEKSTRPFSSLLLLKVWTPLQYFKKKYTKASRVARNEIV